MSTWGDPVVVWSEAVVELVRWRQQRRKVARAAADIVSGAEAFLAAAARSEPPPEAYRN